jgi:hypothetical protein
MSKKKTKKAEHKAKRKADADVAEQLAYKRPSTKASLKQKEPEPVSGLSEEALFRIRHAAEFDDESVVAGNNNLVQVKEEQQDDDLLPRSPSRPTDTTGSPYRARSTPTVAASRAISDSDGLRSEVDQESIFVAILSQGSWDLRMTESAIENLSHRAREQAAQGQVFDVTYVNGIIERLDRMGVEASRRSQVVTPLQNGLRKSLTHWQSCVDQDGSKSPPPPTPLDVHATAFQAIDRGITSTPSSSKTKTRKVETSSKKSDNPAEPRKSPSVSDTSDSVSDSDSTVHDGASESEVDQRSKAYTKVRKAQPSGSIRRSSKPLKSLPNVRLYGTSRPKTAFDIFARCTISAWAIVPGPDDDSIKIREHAKVKWLKVPVEQKIAW